MKLSMISFCMFLSLAFSSSAFAYTSITLKRDVVLDSTITNRMFEGVGSKKRCMIEVASTVNRDVTTVKAGTTFEITTVYPKECKWDMGGFEYSCGVLLMAQNRDQDLRISASCYHTGFKASKMSAEKISEIAKKIITVK